MFKQTIGWVALSLCMLQASYAQSLPTTEQTRFVDGQTVLTKTVVEPTQGQISSSSEEVEKRYLSILPDSEKQRGQDYLRLNRDLENAQIRLRLAEYNKQAIEYEEQINRTQQSVDENAPPSLGSVNIVGSHRSEEKASSSPSSAQVSAQILEEQKQNFFETFKVLGIFRDTRSSNGDYVAELQIDDKRLEVSGKGVLFDDIEVLVTKRFVEIHFADGSDKLTVYPQGS